MAECLPDLDNCYVNFKGKVCDDSDAAGLIFSINITNPNYILFKDKVVTYTSQEDDSHVSGQTHL